MTSSSDLIGVDTTWLVARIISEHPGHVAALEISERLLQSGSRFAIVPMVLFELVHVVTDSRRFANPVEMQRALDMVKEISDSPDTVFLQPTEESINLAWDWMRNYQLGRKRILDTQLAATFHINGIHRILTANPSDFAIFKIFEFI